ncbi:putative glutathione S-transferase [Colletotrichum phormii]|uniref:Glutathione S-transferase n=1 Tax=Colletotrichum phormii TaxID=359342 RepID=A0AAI9ZKF1_9PEZI|nr:putative glutathione S-transferase [Colletotrichum phormii]KAK1633628.1 putative glutathione S-transferase [Colletotrichum phormii]
MASEKLQPIRVWTSKNGPNPWKVHFVLEELGISYEEKYIDFPDMKKPPFEKININGRVPAIEDDNTGITLWESGAILEYLVETYDKEKRSISFEPGTADYFHAKQWLHFQMSGQGPYFGQAIWFHRYHSEDVQSAKDRYIKEIRRVSWVLDRALEGREFLVGDKCSYADIAFIPWFNVAFYPWYDLKVSGAFADQIDFAKEFPNTAAWMDRLRARPIIAETLKKRAATL